MTRLLRFYRRFHDWLVPWVEIRPFMAEHRKYRQQAKRDKQR